MKLVRNTETVKDTRLAARSRFGKEMRYIYEDKKWAQKRRTAHACKERVKNQCRANRQEKHALSLTEAGLPWYVQSNVQMTRNHGLTVLCLTYQRPF